MTVELVAMVNGMALLCGPRPNTYEEFKDIGASTVINLQSGWFEFLHGRNYEEDQWGERADISVAHLPCSDFHAPDATLRETFLKMVRNGLNCGAVYFHCLHGVDRTGIMRAHFRMHVMGWSKDQAVKELLECGFHKFPYQQPLKWIDTL